MQQKQTCICNKIYDNIIGRGLQSWARNFPMLTVNWWIWQA